MSTTTILPTSTQPADMARSRAWTGHFFASAGALPLSFVLDGQAVQGIPADWQPVVSRRRIDANISETLFIGSDPNSGLQIRVECTEYHDYPVVEWVAWFINQGSTATPLIRDILALDGAFAGSSPVIEHGNGDFYSADGYSAEQTALTPGAVLRFAPSGGRPCDQAFPYYRLHFAEGGLSIAIGWPGQWAANFNGATDAVHIQAGQEKTNLRLLPGERIRTPRISLLAWSGDSGRAVNLWRRWYLAHLLPRPQGQPLQPLLACAATDDAEEFTGATEANQLHYIERFKARGIDFDVWWIDAGWYPCYNQEHVRRWWRTGSWEPDAERFPNGLKPISDHVVQAGAALLLWFEPERVQPGTQLDVERPEWLLRTAESDNGLLNLGNPACRQWLTDHVCQLIQQNGIKIYRQDHNFPPLAHWRNNEAADRQGINENLHVQGYLQFWDDLLARNPGLWIDSCASGGRRNDLETMRRSVPLHYTDYGYGDHPVKLAFQRTLYEWIPYFKEVTLSWDLSGNARFDHQIEAYAYHCGMAPMLFATLDIRRDDYDYALARKMIAIWRRASNLLLHGDYYALTPAHRSAQAWVARQFHSPETDRGLVQGIRLPAAEQATLTVRLHGLRADALYHFENAESGESKEIPGNELIHTGFTFALSPRSGAIWFYHCYTAVGHNL
jgi:alpha-galactosidase